MRWWVTAWGSRGVKLIRGQTNTARKQGGQQGQECTAPMRPFPPSRAQSLNCFEAVGSWNERGTSGANAQTEGFGLDDSEP